MTISGFKKSRHLPKMYYHIRKILHVIFHYDGHTISITYNLFSFITSFISFYPCVYTKIGC